MRRFESIVMSVLEPIKKEGTLWFREKMNSIKDNEGKQKKTGISIWYFGNNGWSPIIDLDTRYSTNTNFDFTAADDPIVTKPSNDTENGVVTTDVTYSIYNGNRELGSNANIVNETGLKKHVDDLQSQINALRARVTQLETNLTELTSTVNTISGKVNTNTSSISSLATRVSNLENAE